MLSSLMLPAALAIAGAALLFWPQLKGLFANLVPGKPEPEPPPTACEITDQLHLIGLALHLREHVKQCDGCDEAITKVIVPAIIGGKHEHN